MTAREYLKNLNRHFDKVKSCFEGGLDPSSLAFAAGIRVNPCGDCTMCCVLPAISNAQYQESTLPHVPKCKPFGVKCSLLCDSGCSQYDDRPDVCRGYMCLYTLGVVDKSPLECGVAWSLEPEIETMGGWAVVGHCLDVDKALADPYVMSLVLLFADSRFNGVPVLYSVLRAPKTGVRLQIRQSIEGDRLVLDYKAERAVLEDDHRVDQVTDVHEFRLDDRVLTQAFGIISGQRQ